VVRSNLINKHSAELHHWCCQLFHQHLLLEEMGDAPPSTSASDATGEHEVANAVLSSLRSTVAKSDLHLTRAVQTAT
jgi:hypothetical protein